jgi:hypothetical protein
MTIYAILCPQAPSLSLHATLLRLDCRENWHLGHGRERGAAGWLHVNCLTHNFINSFGVTTRVAELLDIFPGMEIVAGFWC